MFSSWYLNRRYLNLEDIWIGSIDILFTPAYSSVVHCHAVTCPCAALPRDRAKPPLFKLDGPTVRVGWDCWVITVLTMEMMTFKYLCFAGTLWLVTQSVNGSVFHLGWRSTFAQAWSQQLRKSACSSWFWVFRQWQWVARAEKQNLLPPSSHRVVRSH